MDAFVGTVKQFAERLGCSEKEAYAIFSVLKRYGAAKKHMEVEKEGRGARARVIAVPRVVTLELWHDA
jgi:hypothetical protein